MTTTVNKMGNTWEIKIVEEIEIKVTHVTVTQDKSERDEGASKNRRIDRKPVIMFMKSAFEKTYLKINVFWNSRAIKKTIWQLELKIIWPFGSFSFTYWDTNPPITLTYSFTCGLFMLYFLDVFQKLTIIK